MATDTQAPQDGRRRRLDVNPPVFYVAAGLILVFVVLTLVFREQAGAAFGAVQAFIANMTGWFFILSSNIILLFAVVIMISRFGDIRLGGEDAKPDFSLLGWFAMLFSAGMGIGLLFYSVAEPMYHFAAPPLPPFESPEQAFRANEAMGITFLHWGLHPWAIYAMMALGLAYFGFNRGLPLTIRSLFYPLLGERIHGWIGHVIDILATIATLFGVATSLGLGVSQVNAGLDKVFGVEQNTTVQFILIAAITAVATWSVVAGLDKGIRRLSELNMWLAGALLVFVLVVGPTLFILNALVENTGYYIQHLPQLATWTETYTAGDWQNGWTVFYLGWWISWSPFVGMFIARVSRGRTIREFLLGVLFVPTLVTFLWLTIFGDGALYIEMFGAGGIAAAVQESVPQALFAFLDNFPLATVTSLVATLVVITFFVTSSDSGSLVIDIITAGGKLDPPVGQRIFWAVTEGVVAAALLAGGGLSALQTAAITTGLPFAILLVVVCFALYKGLAEDLPRHVAPELEARRARPGESPAPGDPAE